jgi:hypothetical protein
MTYVWPSVIGIALLCVSAGFAPTPSSAADLDPATPYSREFLAAYAIGLNGSTLYGFLNGRFYKSI